MRGSRPQRLSNTSICSLIFAFLCVFLLSSAPAFGATNVSGLINADTTWTLAGSPYVVTSSVTVRGATLTIEPGVEVRFNAGTSLTIGFASPGHLKAQGTSAAPITFTPNNAAPAPGQWQGIVIADSPESSILEYCIIQYAGDWNNANLRIGSSGATVRHCTIRRSSKAGVTLGNSAAILEYNMITENTDGVVFESFNGKDQLRGNTIVGNTTAVRNSQGYTADMRLNWWGSVDGPTSGIVGNVKTEPWLSQQPTGDFGWVSAANSPDPFNPSTAVTTFFGTLPEAATWTVTIRDAANTVVRTLTGTGASVAVDWNGRNTANVVVPNGVYTYELAATSTVGAKVAPPARGQVTANASLPIANITSPIQDKVYTPQAFSITGTATGTAAQPWRLEYGFGYAPTSWSLIKSGTTPVTNGVLASFSVTVPFTTVYTLRLTVTTAAGQAVEQVSFRMLYFASGIFDTPDPFSPNGDGQKDAVTLETQASIPSNWTTTIKNSAGTVVRTLTIPLSYGLRQKWDGKNNAGVLQPTGAYTYLFTIKEPISGATLTSAATTTSLDNTLPTAAITAPIENKVFLTDAPIAFTGSATDTNLDTWKLEYGLGTAPASFTLITTSFTKIAATTLYSLNIQGWNPGVYTFRLTVTDRAGNVSIILRHVTLDHIKVSNVSVTPSTIDPYGTQNAVIQYTLGKTANVTLRVYNGTTKALTRTITTAGQPAGVNTMAWNGKTATNTIPALDAYYFTLEAIDPTNVNRKGSYNYATTPVVGPVPSTFSQTADSTNFDPYKNMRVKISYNINYPGRLTLLIQNSTSVTVRTLLNNALQPAGNQVEWWDGRKDDGKFFQGSFNIYYGVPVAAPLNSIFLIPSPPQVTSFSAEAYVIQPAQAEVSTLSYTLNRDAKVTLSLTDPNGSAVGALFSNLLQTAGPHTFEWNGRNAAGRMVAVEGDYKVTLTTTDPNAASSGTYMGTVTVYK